MALAERSRGLSAAARVVAATALAVAAFPLWLAFAPALDGFSLGIPLAASALAAYLLGGWAGAWATVLGAALAAFAPAPLGFGDPPASTLGLLMFVKFGLALALLVEALHRAASSGDARARDWHMAYRELRHRARNDLQLVLSLMTLRRAAVPSAEARAAIKAVENSVGGIIEVQRQLARAEAQRQVNMRDFLGGLCRTTRATLGGLRPVAIDLEVEPATLDGDRAVTVGLIANELITNSLKHAFPDDRRGRITLAFRRSDDRYVLEVRDDGVGMPETVRSEGIGRFLIQGLAQRLDGTVDLREGFGTHWVLDFPARRTTLP